MPGRKPADQEFVEYVVKSIVDYIERKDMDEYL